MGRKAGEYRAKSLSSPSEIAGGYDKIPPVMAKNLTAKQQKFLDLYLEKELKGAEAYRQAYGSKMPPPLCAKQAYRLLHKPEDQSLRRPRQEAGPEQD
jgi:hypothetical protein